MEMNEASGLPLNWIDHVRPIWSGGADLRPLMGGDTWLYKFVAGSQGNKFAV